MTRNEAIKRSIEIWSKILDGSPKPSPLWEQYHNGCPLCQYTKDNSGKYNIPDPHSSKACLKYCPYANYFRYTCINNRSPYVRWEDGDYLDRKKYAAKFLEQLKQVPLDKPPLFNEYGVLDRSHPEVVNIDDKIRNIAKLIAPIADTVSPVESVAMWDDFSSTLRSWGAEYRLRRAMKMRKEEKNGK